jgi:hypothetical protein
MADIWYVSNYTTSPLRDLKSHAHILKPVSGHNWGRRFACRIGDMTNIWYVIWYMTSPLRELNHHAHSFWFVICHMTSPLREMNCNAHLFWFVIYYIISPLKELNPNVHTSVARPVPSGSWIVMHIHSDLSSVTWPVPSGSWILIHTHWDTLWLKHASLWEHCWHRYVAYTHIIVLCTH